jgi:diguanylate cyclase (GGDEF)-like protein/PAS domain S-box-containing protein
MEQKFFKDLLENLYDGVYYVDTQKVITYWNKSAERISGYRKEEVCGQSCADNILRHINDKGVELCKNGCPLGRTLKDGKIVDIDIFLHHKNGHRVPVSVRSSAIRNEKNEITGAVEIFCDNSKRIDIIKEIESLKKEVFIDQLTQIGNRKFAEMNLSTRMNELKGNKILFGVLFLDIDHFKKFNDTYGHNIGDQVLKMVAKTITTAVRLIDVACRWGGEEFIVILPNMDRQTLAIIAERIRVFIEKSWITVEKENLKVTVSIGGAMATRDDTIESIIHRSDGQMYQSKKFGRNCVTIL